MKVRAWLSQEGIEFSEREFFKSPFSEDELRAILGENIRDRFSWVSPSFKQLGVDRDDLTDDELVSLMLENPRLIRRPLIVVDGVAIPTVSGFNQITTTIAEQLA